ncbi:MAG: DUF6434 domain-containing protein [Aestuariivirga sp.]
MASFDWHGGKITLETPITASCRNTQNVRRFFMTHCGNHFKLDRPFMAWLKNGTPKSMGDAVAEWRRRQENS